MGREPLEKQDGLPGDRTRIVEQTVRGRAQPRKDLLGKAAPEPDAERLDGGFALDRTRVTLPVVQNQIGALVYLETASLDLVQLCSAKRALDGQRSVMFR